MINSTVRQLCETIVVLGLLFAFCGSSFGVETEKTNRPANVPKDFVITPNGYFHPSCVQLLEAGEVVDADNKWIARQGFPTRMLRCEYSHYDAEGREIVAKDSTGASPLTTECPAPNVPCGGDQGSAPASWVIWDAAELLTPLEEFWQTMIVPDAPSVVSGQVIFLFPGLQEGTDTGVTILQGVLAWNGVWVVNGKTYGYQNQWEIVSWNCCYNGAEVFSPPVAVNPGDTVEGEMIGQNCNVSTGICPNWSVDTYDQITNQSSFLSTANGYGQYFQGMFGAVLEVYFVSSCNQFPANNALFGYNSNNSLYGPPFAMRYDVAHPTWIYTPPSWVVTKNPHTAAPYCSYSSVPYGSNGALYLTY